MLKADIRKIYKQKRLALTTKETNVYNDLILINFQKLSLGNFKTLFTYSPIQQLNEVNTEPCVSYLELINPNLTIAYPLTNTATSTMQAMVLHANSYFDINKWGIAEPVNGTIIAPNLIDVIFIPLLAFDNKGYRVGYGKGFYDKFLKNCKTDIIKIGFSFFEPVPLIQNIDIWDEPLNFCITPHTIYEF